jgi:hypothetical protein
VQFEMFKWIDREIGEEDANEFLAFSTQCAVVALSTKVAVKAAAIAKR